MITCLLRRALLLLVLVLLYQNALFETNEIALLLALLAAEAPIVLVASAGLLRVCRAAPLRRVALGPRLVLKRLLGLGTEEAVEVSLLGAVIAAILLLSLGLAIDRL